MEGQIDHDGAQVPIFKKSHRGMLFLGSGIQIQWKQYGVAIIPRSILDIYRKHKA